MILARETHAGELRAHPRHVGRVPVEVPAARAMPKLLLGRVHELGNSAGGFLARNLLELGIALDASSKQSRRRIDRKGGDHLTDLLAKMIALHEQIGRHLSIADQTAVPREHDSPPVSGFLEQSLAREIRPIEHVTAENAQPTGQPPEHLVGDETRFLERSQSRNPPLSAEFVAPADTVKYCFSQGKVAGT